MGPKDIVGFKVIFDPTTFRSEASLISATISKRLNDCKVFVFDFDGTLVDSVHIKFSAFELVFSDFPEHREEISAFCRSANDLTRSDKFREIYTNILRREYRADDSTWIHKRFEALTTDAIVRAPEISGATSLLQRVSGSRVTELLSATPSNILEDIVTRRGWLHFFDHIEGAPVNKTEYLRSALKRYAIKPLEVVYFGDSPEDAEAAKAVGCQFIGVGASQKFSSFLYCADTLTELADLTFQT